MTSTDIHGHEPGDSLTDGTDAGAPATGAPGPDLTPTGNRVTFNEGFDRVIAENVRRSGELMLEMLAMRDSMTASSAREIMDERERIGNGLAAMDAGLQAIRTQVDVLAGQVSDLRRALGTVSGPARPEPAASPVPDGPLAPATPPPTLDQTWETPRIIDVIVHHVPRATVALSLQRHLGRLDQVAGVEAREFAEGVLRMQVTARQPLVAADLASWTDGGAVTVLTIQPQLVEFSLDAHS